MPGSRTCTRESTLFASVSEAALSIIITDVYNRPGVTKKGDVMFNGFHSKTLGKTGNISERIVNPSPVRFIPWLSRKRDYSEQLTRFSCQLFLIGRYSYVMYCALWHSWCKKQMYLLVLHLIRQGPLGSLRLALSVVYYFFLFLWSGEVMIRKVKYYI